MGLNDSYGQARGTILIMNPLPDINVAYSLLLQDENQKETYMSSLMPSDSSSFMVNSMNQYRGRQSQQFTGNNFRSGNSYPRPPNNSPAPQKSQKQFQKFKEKKEKYDPNANCSHCGKNGHLKINCFRLIGFPEDFQFTHEKGNHSQIRANAAATMEEAKPILNAHTFSQHFNKEQLNFLHQALTQMKMEENTSTSNENGKEQVNANAVAGPFYEEPTSFW
ncbi:uncharacterized protein LOC125841520 [Solanum stenotomum]|uniref:uncharacterized protein LOC125841520 n=1 Tax=Solanum stenotomum TaxID=172797 RepID=UPI0020D155E3|nr:uncharacterized protein LOC125841520 [Solanum stenotomum]